MTNPTGNGLRILDAIRHPRDLRAFTHEQLERLAGEIREEIIATVTANGGHLASNLGVVELTLALHRVFESPEDAIVWDTSNQAYAHKLVTGRASRFRSLRKLGGISGFLAREESPHDVMGAGHAGTGVSAGVGIALATQHWNSGTHTVTVIGDGSFTSGVVFEAMNQAGDLAVPFVLVLNDNGMSISPNVGALGRNLGQARSHPRHTPMGDRAANCTPSQLKHGPTVPNSDAPAFFNAFGFEYIGPVDGHDLAALERALSDAKARAKPVCVHVFTTKGKGLSRAELDPITLHQPGTATAVGAANATSYSKVFAHALIEFARADDRIVAISAAMMEGTALVDMQRALPGRVYDAGIAEGHAVAMAAGMAARGLRPVVCIYSTFLQRAFDQIVHDVAIQRLPVVFGVDRAGVVGDDGRTHHGVLDIAYLRAIPNLIVAAPRDEAELRDLLRTALDGDQPFAIRYSRGIGLGVPVDSEPKALPIGRAELLQSGDDVALLALGWGVAPALQAAERLRGLGVSVAVVNARFVKPLDSELIAELAEHTRRIVTIEDHNAMGGFGSAVLEMLADRGLSHVAAHRMALPDQFLDHGPAIDLRAAHGLSVDGIVAAAQALVENSMHVRVDAGRLFVSA